MDIEAGDGALLTESDESEGLTGPVVRSGKWLFLSQTVVRAMLVVRTLVLIGLLTKEDWGLWAAIFTTLHLLRNLTDAGLHLVVIRRRDGDSPEVLLTAWWLNVLRGIVLAVLLLTLAPVIALCFPDSGTDLKPLLRLVAVVFLMEGFVSVGTITAERHLAFGRLVLVQQGSAFLGIVSAIVLGVIFRNVRALVFAEMLRATLLLILSYIVMPVRPSLGGSLGKARALWRSGWHLYVAKLFEFLIVRGPVFLVGPVCGTAQLGLYHLALNFGTFPSEFILTVVNRAIFPAFAKMQDDPERLKRALLRVQRFVVVVAAPVCLGVVALAPVVAAFGGRESSSAMRFAGMVLPMQVLALGVYVTCQISINFMMMLGLGHLDVVRRLTFFHLILVALAVYPLTRYSASRARHSSHPLGCRYGSWRHGRTGHTSTVVCAISFGTSSASSDPLLRWH